MAARQPGKTRLFHYNHFLAIFAPRKLRAKPGQVEAGLDCSAFTEKHSI